MSEAATSSTPQVESATKPAAPDATKTDSPDTGVEAINMLAQGKRNMLVGEIPQACNQLQQACRLLASKYGETGEECAESYLLYGKALLELSRMESGVLGNALQGIEEESEKSEDSSDEKTEESEKMTDDESEKETEDEEAASEEAASEDIADEEGEGTTENEGEGTADEEGAEGEAAKPDAANKSAEEDVSNLQLAWEMLELAKNIYGKTDNKETKLKLAECNLKLGEVGLETEQYEQAIGDFKSCLSVQSEVLDAEDRCLAETNYQLGLACTYNAQYEDAISSYKKAASVIETKIAKLEKVVEAADKAGKGKEPAAFDDPVVLAQKEIKELKEILPDIMSKIEDVEDESKSADKVKQMVKENLATEMGTATTGFTKTEPEKTSAKTTESKPASDISHLVRKKRKPEDDAEEATKKAKVEEGSGDAPKKGSATNGVDKPKPAKGAKVEASS